VFTKTKGFGFDCLCYTPRAARVCSDTPLNLKNAAAQVQNSELPGKFTRFSEHSLAKSLFLRIPGD
jgi:hypothetical protein